MQYNILGTTDVRVSKICLGTMTFGEQNTEKEAHEQLNYAIQQGVNFIDTAEMYPVPPCKGTQGLTEEYIGSWLKKSSQRDKIILATKVAGPGMMSYLRNGPQLSPEHINAAINASLKRLQTDYIDLYQVHWPSRNTNYFGKLGYQHNNKDTSTSIEDTYACLVKCVEQGKVRHIGISNETPWGAMKYQHLARTRKWPYVVSIQNPYNLLNRTFEIGMAEISHRENIGLLAYSPLGFGVLSGKYLNSMLPDKARLTLFERFNRYSNKKGIKATQAYCNLAIKNGYLPAQMALSFVTSRPFVTSNIIGATSIDQLKENLASVLLELPNEVLEEIEMIHQEYQNPCP